MMKKVKNVPQLALEYGFVGPAIPYMYEFLKKKYPDIKRELEIEIGALAFDLETNLLTFPSKKVFEYGMSGKCNLCEKVV